MFIEKEREIRLKEVTVDQFIDRISGQTPNYSLVCLGTLTAKGQGDGVYQGDSLSAEIPKSKALFNNNEGKCPGVGDCLHR